MKFLQKLEVNGRNFDVYFENINKLRSSVRIKNKEIHIKISKLLKGKKRDETLEVFLNWATKRLSHFSKDFIEPVYKNKGKICTHNKIYEIEVIEENRQNSRIILENDFLIRVFLNNQIGKTEKQKKIKFLAQKKIIEDQTPYLKELIKELNDLYFCEKYNEVRFKRVGQRFGSCSNLRNINIAFKLLFAPREVFRYVCIHELAHLKEFNHSKKFWALVKEAMPEYKEQEKWLKLNGFMLG